MAITKEKLNSGKYFVEAGYSGLMVSKSGYDDGVNLPSGQYVFELEKGEELFLKGQIEEVRDMDYGFSILTDTLSGNYSRNFLFYDYYREGEKFTLNRYGVPDGSNAERASSMGSDTGNIYNVSCSGLERGRFVAYFDRDFTGIIRAEYKEGFNSIETLGDEIIYNSDDGDDEETDFVFVQMNEEDIKTRYMDFQIVNYDSESSVDIKMVEFTGFYYGYVGSYGY